MIKYFRAPLMQKADWFNQWFGTKYYTLLYGNRNNAEAKPLVTALVRELPLVPKARVWDMACGRGRHLFWINASKLTALGSDLSERSIADARLNVPDAEFKVHDMRQGPAFLNVDLCLNLFTSMGYFESTQDDIKVLQSAFLSMNSQAFFVLDYLNAETVAKNLVPISEKVVDQVRFTSTRTIKDGFIRKHIQVVDGQEKIDFYEKVRAYTPDVLADMAESVGLQVQSILGEDMEGTVENSARCVLIAQKK